MVNAVYSAPSFKMDSFNCPLCNAYAHQSWNELHRLSQMGFRAVNPLLFVSICTHCKSYSLWMNEAMLYPSNSGVEPPQKDLSEDIKKDYQEAADILNRSPRGATALLRLIVEKLCNQLHATGDNINEKIAFLVKAGLPVQVQQSLDSLRVIGNEAVHAGQIDLSDSREIAIPLFRLINIIAEKMITEPAMIEEIYKNLPEKKLQAIALRDFPNKK